jgi:hypothetical protein
MKIQRKIEQIVKIENISQHLNSKNTSFLAQSIQISRIFGFFLQLSLRVETFKIGFTLSKTSKYFLKIVIILNINYF